MRQQLGLFVGLRRPSALLWRRPDKHFRRDSQPFVQAPDHRQPQRPFAAQHFIHAPRGVGRGPAPLEEHLNRAGCLPAFCLLSSCSNHPRLAHHAFGLLSNPPRHLVGVALLELGQKQLH